MPAMDIDSSFPKLDVQRSPPIRIASPARQPAKPVAQDETMPIPKLDHAAINEKVKKRKKNKKKAMPAATPAAKVIIGFETPVASGGEESDFSRISTPMLGATKLPSVTGTPGSSPSLSGSGLSVLKARLDKLSLDTEDRRANLARVMSNASTTLDGNMTPSSRGGSDGDKTEMESYDVPLNEDFISPEADSGGPIFASHAVEGGLHKSINRKMCADDFEKLRCLGKGAFGTVHLVKQHASGRLYAQKQFKKASLTVHRRLIEQTRTERSILESINRHPFVVKLFYAFQDQERLYLILEYAQGGELFHHLAMEHMFSEDTASFYMAEMVLALEHLHQNVRVIYRDLKPENCLLDAEGHLLLTDFGLSKVAAEDDADSRANSVLGTIEYMAPEVVRGDNYDFTVDWWSLGAIGFDLLTGHPPFGGGNHARIQQNILKQKLQLPYFLGPDAKDFLTRLLRKEPSKRIGGTSAKDVKALKAHRFFRKIDWKKLERREVEPPIQPLVTDPELAENFDAEFTDLPLSPVLTRKSGAMDIEMSDAKMPEESNPFGGFSFVASESLLESEGWLLGA